MAAALALAVGWAFAGCAPEPQPQDEASLRASEGDPDAPPSLRALPELRPGDSGSTPRCHQGLLLARQAFDAAMPVPPADRSYGALKRWVDGAVSGWLERRRAQIDATRARFSLEGAPSPSEEIVSHAVVALIEEDTSRALGEIPQPGELDDEPEILAMYRDLARSQAKPLLVAAIDDLAECANRAYRGPGDMRPWARFCHARYDRLLAQLAGPEGAASARASQ
jgi:hypothetical protein